LQNNSELVDFDLPLCKFIHVTHIGNYNFLEDEIPDLIDQALASGYKLNLICGIRIAHINSPDNTFDDKLQSEIYLPVL